jgi:hypothetical protein
MKIGSWSRASHARRWPYTGSSGRLVLVRLATIAVLGALGVGAPCTADSAYAAAFGEIEKVGGFGTGPGQLHWPADLAVDPEEGNSVFVVDTPEGLGPGSGPKKARIQKFDATLGASVASATVPLSEEPVHELVQHVSNLAVDPSLGRLYVLKKIETTNEGPAEDIASEIVVYSTVADASNELPLDSEVPNSGVFYTFPVTLPSGPLPPGALRNPHGLAVEPKTHDLLVLGADEAGNTVIQRITATGLSHEKGKLESGGEFDDTSDGVADETAATGIAAGAEEGTIYLGSRHIKNGGAPPAVLELSTTAPNSFANPKIKVLREKER